MTGRDIIVYILQNNLEDEDIYGIIANGFMDYEEAAVKFGVGISTVRTWVQIGLVPSFRIGTSVYLLKSTPDPRKTNLEQKESK